VTSFLTQYRVLPQLAGRWFLPIGFLARLPFSMTQIGTVVLVTAETGSVAAGGLVAGLLAAGMALGGPLVGVLSSRLGQRVVLAVSSLLTAALTVGLVLLVIGGAPLALVGAAAFAGGVTSPPVGPLVRVRWVGMAAGSGRNTGVTPRGPASLVPRSTDRSGAEALPTAMSYEGAADEVAYVLGPALVSVLAAVADPVVAVLTAAVLVGVFGTLVALHPTAAAAPLARVRGERPRTGLPPAVLFVVAGGLVMGAYFGALQTGVAGVATAAGAEAATGLVYACMAVGSAVAALAMASAPPRWQLPDRLVVFSAALPLLLLPLLLVTAPALLAVLLVPLGLAVGPTLLTLYSLAESTVEASRVAVVMTALSSGVVVGYAVGSALGGRLVEDVAPAAPFAMAVVVAVLGTGNALLLRRAMRRGGQSSRRSSSRPSTASNASVR
jgi:MFS family permease